MKKQDYIKRAKDLDLTFDESNITIKALQKMILDECKRLFKLKTIESFEWITQDFADTVRKHSRDIES